MAKARDLAALAGLAGLAYAMRKGKYNEDAGDQKTSSYTKDTKKVESKDGDEGYKNNVLKAITQKREGSNDQAGNQGVLGGDKPASKSTSKPASKAAPKLETLTTRKDPREAEAGMSRGTRPSVAKNSDYSNEGRNSIAPSKSTSTSSSSEEGMSNYKPRRTSSTSTDPRSAEAGMSRGTRTTSMAGAGRGSVNPPNVSPTDPRSAESGMSRGTRTTSMAGAGRGFVNPPVSAPKDPREAEAGMSRGTRTTTPPFKGGQRGYDEAGNFMGGQRGFDEAGNPMKKGGMVKKMASGGMTASRRADGIATKGKTRGKIC
jgi:hypothetical protein